MSKDSKKNTKNKNKKVEYPRKGVNRLWDALFELQGVDQIFEAIPDEATKREILNFTAGLSAKFSTEIEKMEKKVTPQAAREMYKIAAKDLGKSQKEIEKTITSLEASEAGMEAKIRAELKKKEDELAKKQAESDIEEPTEE